MNGQAGPGNHVLPPEQVAPAAHAAVYWMLADTLVMAKRQLIKMPRIPDELMAATVQPILFVLLFRYVFGGAIAIRGTSYINYLMPGIFVQSVIFAAAATGVGVAIDLQRGLVDRFRSLPMAKSAVLTGRTLADLIRITFIVVVLWAVGLLVGFRPEGTILAWLAAMGLLLLSCYTFSWFSALLGLLLSSAEAVQQAVVIWAFPLVFASSALVPTNTMPGWLRAFAEHQPVSLLINAIRGLLLKQPNATATWQAIVWYVSLLVVFIPLTVWAYGRRTTR